MDIFIESNDIKQYHISESLIKSEAFNLYKKQLNIYSCKKTSTIFFGVYTMADITHIKNHTGTKFIYWAGNDANISNINRIKVINLLKKFNINQHLCCNKLIQSNLKLLNVDSLIMNINESKYIKKYFDINQINQIHISSALIHLKDQIFNKFNFRSYDNLNEDCIFFGLYNTKDIDLLNKHNGKKYLMWGGNDALFESKAFYLNYLEKKNLFHISISNDLFDRLTKFNLDPLIFRLNLVNTEIFKPVNERGHKIFIYNGINKGQEETYGKSIYDEIVKRLPEYEYIYSNELNVPNEKMPEIYAQCFIGLRLTKNDGNANMVQEMEAMNIPVVHNLSDYGLKWNSVDDIIGYINNIKLNDPCDLNIKITVNNNYQKEARLNGYDYLVYFSNEIINTYISTQVNKKIGENNDYKIIECDDFFKNDNWSEDEFINFIKKNKVNNNIIIDVTSMHLLMKTKNIKIFTILDKYNIFNLYSKKTFLIMDLHDYSIEEITGIGYSYDYDHGLKLFKNEFKDRLDFYLKKNNIDILSWNYQPEVIFFCNNYNIPLNLCYGYYYYNDIFKKLQFNKNIDILFYGNPHPTIYKTRDKINNLMNNNEFNYYRFNIDYTKQKELVEIINRSYITITCTSIYSYFVRKYIEILICGSLPAGDINNEGLYQIKHNFIYLNYEMNDNYIQDKIKYYLMNKDIINKLTNNGMELIKKNISNMKNINSKKIIEEYKNQNIFDFIHLYDNFNKLDIINFDKLYEIVNFDKSYLLKLVNKIIILYSDKNYKTSDYFNTNKYIVIKTNSLNNVQEFLKFTKICVFDKECNEDELHLLKNNKIIVLIKSNFLFNKFNNIIYFENFNLINLLIKKIFKYNIKINDNDENNYLLIGIGSGIIDYGGISVVCRQMFNFMKSLNFNVKLFLYGSTKNEIIENDFYHNNYSSFYDDMSKNINEKTKIILLNWLNNEELLYIKNLPNHSHFFVPGLIRDDMNTWINSTKYLKNDYHSQNIKTIFSTKTFSFCSNLISNLFQRYLKYEDIKLNKNILTFYDNGIYLNYNVNKSYEVNKIYDIGFIVSDFRRNIKNANLVYDIINYLHSNNSVKTNILLIGQNINRDFLNNLKNENGSNIDYYFQLDNEACIEYISKVKIVLCTSYFDAYPTVAYECFQSNTIFLTSTNCGAIDHINKKYIIYNYENIYDWINMINTILTNYDKNINYYNFDYNNLSLYNFENIINGKLDLSKMLFKNNINMCWIDKISDVFQETFAKNYNLKKIYNLNDINESCIYFGISQASLLKQIENNKHNINIIIFIGSDSYFFLNEKDKGHLLPYINDNFFKNNYFIAISDWIYDDLKQMNIPESNIRRINLLGSNIYRIINTEYIKKRGEFIYLYTALNEIYGINIIKKIYMKLIEKNSIFKNKIKLCTNPIYYNMNKELIENFNNSSENVFYPNKLQSMPKDDLYDLYNDIFIGFRITTHDGNSNTICELGGLGIKCIHNGNQPNCINYNIDNIDGIVNSIIFEYNNREVDYKHISDQTKSYLQKTIDIPWTDKDFWL
jgi:hypothetical protein